MLLNSSFKRLRAPILISVLTLFTATSSYAERLIFVPQLAQFNDTLPNDTEKKRELLNRKILAPQDKEQASALLILAKSSFDNDADAKALAYANQALNLLERQSQTSLLANAYYIRALINSVGLRQYPESVKQFKQVLTTINGVHSDTNVLHAKSSQKLGSLLMYLKKPEQAVHYIKQTLNSLGAQEKITIAIDARLDLAKYHLLNKDFLNAEKSLKSAYKQSLKASTRYQQKTLIQISRFYRKLKRYNLAIDYGEQVIKLIQHSSDPTQLAWAHNNLAIAYEESGDLNMAIIQYLNSLNNAKEKQSVFVALAQHNIGLIYAKQKKWQQSIDYLTRANQLLRSIDHPYYLMHSNLSLGETFRNAKDLSQSITHYKFALEQAIIRKDKETSEDVHTQLIEIFLAQENFKSAQHHTHALNELLKQKLVKISQEKEKKTVASTDPAQDNWQKLALDREVKINLLNKQVDDAKHQSKLTLYALSSLAFILSLLIALFWKFNRVNKIKMSRLEQLTENNFQPLIIDRTLPNTLMDHYGNADWLIAIELPLLAKLHLYMNHETGVELTQHWLENIKKALPDTVFKLRDSLLICGLRKEQNKTTAQVYDSLLAQFISALPAQHRHLIAASGGIKVGGASLKYLRNEPTICEATNTVNLALFMLTTLSSLDNKPPIGDNYWLLAHSHAKDQNSIFNFTCQKEWLFSIKNKLISIEGNTQIEIDWDKVIEQR